MGATPLMHSRTRVAVCLADLRMMRLHRRHPSVVVEDAGSTNSMPKSAKCKMEGEYSAQYVGD